MLNAVENAQHMRVSLQSIAAQAEKPALVAVEYAHGMRQREDIQALVEDYPEDLPIVTLEDFRLADMPEAALKTCRAQIPDLLGIIFIEGGQRLAEGAVAACGAVFRHASQVGMAAFWVQSSARKDDIQLTHATLSRARIMTVLSIIQALTGRRHWKISLPQPCGFAAS